MPLKRPLPGGRLNQLKEAIEQVKKQALAIMAKEPISGQTKTRLCPPLTAEQAADLYRCFLEDIICTVGNAVGGRPDIRPYIAYSPIEAVNYFRNIAPDFDLIPQVGARLNERLQSVFSAAFELGYQQVAAMNSDSPTLPGAYLIEAFERLESTDVVLGPCEDGGYYLIGLNRPIPEIILPVQMSTDRVLADTLALITGHGLTVELLPTWYDVDTIVELSRLEKEIAGLDSRTADWFNAA
jgi:rSAM/selenodomain-associated transferase 1